MSHECNCESCKDARLLDEMDFDDEGSVLREAIDELKRERGLTNNGQSGVRSVGSFIEDLQNSRRRSGLTRNVAYDRQATIEAMRPKKLNYAEIAANQRAQEGQALTQNQSSSGRNFAGLTGKQLTIAMMTPPKFFGSMRGD